MNTEDFLPEEVLSCHNYSVNFEGFTLMNVLRNETISTKWESSAATLQVPQWPFKMNLELEISSVPMKFDSKVIC